MKILIEADAEEIATLISMLLGRQSFKQSNFTSSMSSEEFENAIQKYQRRSSKINF